MRLKRVTLGFTINGQCETLKHCRKNYFLFSTSCNSQCWPMDCFHWGTPCTPAGVKGDAEWLMWHEVITRERKIKLKRNMIKIFLNLNSIKGGFKSHIRFICKKKSYMLNFLKSKLFKVERSSSKMRMTLSTANILAKPLSCDHWEHCPYMTFWSYIIIFDSNSESDSRSGF